MYSEAVEKNVVVSCLHDETFMAEVYETLSPNHFNQRPLKWIYRVAKEHFRKYGNLIDKTVLVNELTKSKKLSTDQKKLFKKIGLDLLKTKPKHKRYSKDEMGQYIADVSFVQCLDNISQIVEDGNLEKARTIMSQELLARESEKGYIISNWLEEFEDRQKIRKKRKLNPEDYFMVRTPYRHVRRVLDGIRCGEVASITGITSSGKSIMLQDWGANAFIDGTRTFHATLENTLEQTNQRYDSNILRIPYDAFKRYKFSKKQIAQIERNMKALRDLIGENLRVGKFPNSGTTVLLLEKALRDLELSGFYTQFLVLDYADIMDPVKKWESFRLGQGGVYWDIKALALDRNLPLLNATQAKAEYGIPDKKGRVLVPTAESASESYWKARILDIMLTLYQTTKQKFMGVATAHIAKNRDGPRGAEFLLKEDFPNMRFLEA